MNLCFFGPSEFTAQTENRSVQPFLHSSVQSVVEMPGHVLPLIIAPSHERSGSHLMLQVGPPESIIQTTFRSVQPFLHRSRQNVPILYNRTSLPRSKLSLPVRGSGPQSNTRFPGSTRVLNPNGISISSAVFAGLTSVTDRPTDHATRSVTVGCIYVRSILRCGLKSIFLRIQDGGSPPFWKTVKSP